MASVTERNCVLFIIWNIVNRREGFETHEDYKINHYLCFSGFCRNEDFHRHVPIVFLPS